MSSLAKTTVPRLRAIHPNERLFRLLDHASAHRVVWIHGPPGAGKTTLVASYLKARRLNPVWHRLDEGDADPATFFYFLGRAAEHAATRDVPLLPMLTAIYSRGLPAFTRQYFQNLHERLPRRSLLVFDDYHEVALDSPLHELIVHGLAETPESRRVVVVSRAEPPPQLARLRANDLMEVVSPEALRLDVDEVRGVVASRGRIDRGDADLAALTAATQGWVAGVILMLESGKAPPPGETTGLDPRSPQLVFDYFAEEVFRRLDPAAQDVLLATAVPPAISADMAERLTANSRAGDILEALVHKNYFIARDAQTEPVYKYHPLFREFLLTRAKKLFKQEQLSAISERAALLLEQAGHPEAAVELLQGTGNWERIAAIALTSAKLLIDQGRYAVLGRWLDCLPASLIEDDGWLCYWRGFALLPAAPAAAITWFQRAFTLFERNRDRPGLLLSWARIIQAIRFDPKGDVKQMDPWIAMADGLLAEDSGFPSEEIEYQFVYGMYVALQHRRPWHPRFGAWRDRAIALGLSETDSANRVYLAYLAVSYETQRGHLVPAKLILEAASRVQDLSALARSFSYLGRIQIEIELGRLDEALATMTAGLDHARRVGIHTWDTFLRWHGGRAALLCGDVATALSLLADIAANADVSCGVAGCYYNYLASFTALLEGSLPTAAKYAERAIELAEATGWLISQARSRLLYSRVLLELGELGGAKDQLGRMLPLAVRIDYPAVVSQGLMQQALIAFAEDDPATALDALRRALRLARELSFRQSLWFCPTDGTRLCSRALAAGIEPDFVREVIRQRRVLPEAPDIVDWPWPVKVFTLGRFLLLKDDRPLEFPRKTPRKPLALLKAVIASGGAEVPETRLTEALWQDEEADSGHQAFAIAVHRLRKLLGNDEIIQIHEGRVTLNQCNCWVDAWAFERLLAEADRATRAGKREEFALLVRKALDLYGGVLFAEDSDAPWTISPRERLRSLFIRHAAALAGHLHEMGRHDDAIALYLRGIDADPLAEEFYQGLMRCYRDGGRRAEGLAVYRRLRQTISVMLGVKPAPASEALYRALLNES
ncbi:MAG TPA: BTAD domain-containing putative transcriptional regulator [Burkholderiales bacterium]|nr:BTAD domain-containing putative transcriptional regulator [Burkholderiales bacterium]